MWLDISAALVAIYILTFGAVRLVEAFNVI
jgi:hypothetical protein